MRLARFERATYPLKGRTPFVELKMIKYHFKIQTGKQFKARNKQMEETLPVERSSAKISMKKCAWRDSNARPIP